MKKRTPVQETEPAFFVPPINDILNINFRDLEFVNIFRCGFIQTIFLPRPAEGLQ